MEIKGLTYNYLKMFCQEYFGAEFPWEVDLGLLEEAKDQYILILLWSEFTHHVSSCPRVPEELMDIFH
jgi:hypothetical protein